MFLDGGELDIEDAEGEMAEDQYISDFIDENKKSSINDISVSEGQQSNKHQSAKDPAKKEKPPIGAGGQKRAAGTTKKAQAEVGSAYVS